VPGAPDDSELIALVEDGSMPPDDSGIPLVSDADRAFLRAWIAAGAPLPSAAPGVAPSEDRASVAVEVEPDAVRPRPQHGAHGTFARLVRWVAHFHPVLVHFPVALRTVAPLAELLAVLFGSTRLRDAATFCLAVSALAAAPSSVPPVLARRAVHAGQLPLRAHSGVLLAVPPRELGRHDAGDVPVRLPGLR